MICRLLPFILAPLLTACAVVSPDETGSLAQADRVQPGPADPAPRRSDAASARAVLPGEAGRIVEVTSQTFGSVLRQSIVMGDQPTGLRPNRISLDIGQGSGPPPTPPTESAIRAELAAEVPVLEMLGAEQPRRNAYGIYGLASGHAVDGSACLYAWQWLDHAGPAGGSEAASPMSLRLRLCAKDKAADQLASLADRLTLRPGGEPDVSAHRKPAPRISPVASRRSAAPVARAEVSTRPGLASAPPRPSASTDVLDITLPPAALIGPSFSASRRS